MSEVCKICNEPFAVLNSNHLRTHGLTLAEYREKYGGGREKVKKVASKVNSKKKQQLSHQSARTLEELYQLDKTIVVPKRFTRVTEDNKHLLKDIKEMAYEYKIIDVDTETTGLNPFYDIITDLIITIGEEPTYSHNYHIPMLHVDRGNNRIPGQLPVRMIRDWVEDILLSPEVGKTFHNALFDCMMFWEVWGIKLVNIAYDTLAGGRLLNENERNHKLKGLYGKYCHPDETDPEIKALGVETYEEQFDKIKFFRVPMNVATCYACKDGYMLRRLREFQTPYIDTVGNLRNVLYNIEMPLIPVLLDMRKEGIGLDLDRAKELDNILAEEVVETEKRLREFVGDINMNSPKQLSKVLFEDLKLPNIGKGSTKKEVMEDLADMGYEVPSLIIEYRGKEKLRSTYTSAAEQYIQEKTGKVHTNFNPYTAVTGRFGSSNPNLQNIPARKDKRIRTMFLVETGHVFSALDFSQIEPRILAHLSQDPVMLQAFRSGDDIYASMAAEVYSEVLGINLTPADCGDGTSYRTNMKTILLGIMYEMTNKGLGKKLRVDKNQAQDIIDSFFYRHKGVAKYVKELKRFCKEEGYVETIDGRKRRLPGIWSDEWWIRKKTERQVLNSAIQGTAADIIKKAMLKIGYDEKVRELGGKMLLTVHDELDVKAPIETCIEANKLMVMDMMSAWDLSVPIHVDADLYYDRRWYGKKASLIQGLNGWEILHNNEVIDGEEFIWLAKTEQGLV